MGEQQTGRTWRISIVDEPEPRPCGMLDDEQRADQEALNQLLPGLLNEHAGQFVLFYRGEVVEIFETFEAAYAGGIERFGLDSGFTVSRVEVRRPAWGG